MTDRKTRTKQIRVSKNLLVNALLALMSKQPFNTITISELTQVAGVSRRTFYRHFKKIEDILTYYLEDLLNLLIEKLMKQEKFDLQSIVIQFFEFWKQYTDFLVILDKNNLFYLIFGNFFPKAPIEHGDYQNIEEESYAYYFIIGGLCNLLLKWIRDGAKLKPTDIEKIVETMLTQFK
ncbi:TetR/AcrR family transcriptional regulator [Lactobacillus sp. ESL0684]|uniref:TetR/AcrR family transcriptional regulator n=1 Tax=Lactobacillus sp. ESL0684 TaxID=2983213 RepID=UPI0023F6C4DD|nr:TetR/AcrR family transcriptional regulator [Lactobacillus sp. ESL0684]WEV43682.1 TetR/AcrR family transcriptional regulator [Lactobacillus sp. ESL0684]